MNNFLAGISICCSAVALALSGWTASQISLFNKTISEQQNNIGKQEQQITQQDKAIAKLTQELEANQEKELFDQSARPTNLDIATQSVSNSQRKTEKVNSPEELVRKGFNNQVKIELLSVERIQNPKSNVKDAVVVKLQLRSLVAKPKVRNIAFNQVKGRNPSTSEVYRTISGKYSKLIYTNRLSQDAWGNAYFWLEIPEEVNVVDIVIPETAIFDDVPIDWLKNN